MINEIILIVNFKKIEQKNSKEFPEYTTEI